MRILVVQPSFQPPGGGNAVACWFLEVLRAEHDLTSLSVEPVSVPEINRFYGTSLRETDFRSIVVPAAARVGATIWPTRTTLLQMHVLARYAKRISADYDLVIGANNETDFGRAGIQYVHYPWLSFPRPAVEYRWYHVEPLLSAYYRVCQRVSGFSPDSMRANLTLANSEWTAGVIRQVHGIDAETLYPPVPGPFPTRPWETRRDAFVIIGRFSREKRFELAIDILEGVRARGFPIDLHIIGTPGDRPYLRQLGRRAERAGSWVTFHRNLPRRQMLDLISSVRYGLHAMQNEHFGIAVAEILQSGCIPFVPQTGGQVEIVGSDPALVWESRDDAVEKITRVLGSPDLQAEILARAAGLRQVFTTERFAARLRDIVRERAPAARAS